MKTVYEFAPDVFDPMRWAEVVLNLLAVAFRQDETVKYSFEVSADGVTKIEIVTGEKTGKLVNLEHYLSEMGGRKVEPVVIFPL